MYVLFSFFFLTEEMFPLLTDHSFIPEFHLEIKQQGTWVNQGMCACVRFAWALVLRTCSQWPNIVGAVEVLEKDEEELDLAVQENVLSFLRHSVVRATNFHQEVCHYFFLSPLYQKYIKIEMKKLICILACALNMKLLKFTKLQLIYRATFVSFFKRQFKPIIYFTSKCSFVFQFSELILSHGQVVLKIQFSALDSNLFKTISQGVDES